MIEGARLGYLWVWCLPHWKQVVQMELCALFLYEWNIPADEVDGLCCFCQLTVEPDEEKRRRLSALVEETGGEVWYGWSPLERREGVL